MTFDQTVFSSWLVCWTPIQIAYFSQRSNNCSGYSLIYCLWQGLYSHSLRPISRSFRVMIDEPKYSTTSNMEVDRHEGWDRLKQGKNDETQEIFRRSRISWMICEIKTGGTNGKSSILPSNIKPKPKKRIQSFYRGKTKVSTMFVEEKMKRTGL